MRILQLHCDFIEYAAKEAALKGADKITDEAKKPKKVENALVIFTSVENGDTLDTIKEAAVQVKKHFENVKAKHVVLYPYAHLSSDLAKPADAQHLLDLFHEEVKKFEPEALKSPFGWYKQFALQCKGHPLAELSKTIRAETNGKVVAIKGKPELNELQIKTVAGTGAKRELEETVSQSLKKEEEMKSEFCILTPAGELIPYDKFDYSKHADLKAFIDYEVKKVRVYAQEPPHIKLMKEHDLIRYEPASDQGNFRWLPKGHLMKKSIEHLVTDRVIDYGAIQVETPIMYDYEHPALKKYLNRFPARQYVVKSDEKDFFLRFSACFGQFLAAHDMTISHKDLPLKIYELTHYSFRREQSGELAGLKRLRTFSMPDMHTFCTDLVQAKKEFESQYRLCAQWNHDLELPVEMAFRAQTDFFQENKKWYVEMVKHFNKPILIELFKERYAYFITKFEMNFLDSARKATCLSTVQIDVENSETFDMTYVDKEGKKQNGVILHDSVPGAVERVVYAILEREAMKIAKGQVPNWPLWLAPTQIRLVPVTDAQLKYCEQLLAEFRAAGFRADLDDRSETLQKKIRAAEQEWVPFTCVVGEREQKEHTVAVRVRGEKEQLVLAPADLMNKLDEKLAGFPREKLALPAKLSIRPKF